MCYIDTMATIQEKRNFLEHIKNETKHYEIRLEGVGCESVMGFVTPQLYKYWNKKTDTELGSYVAEYRDINMLEKVPADAQLNREWYEYDDIAHVSGIVLNRNNTLYIDRYDKKFRLEETVLRLDLDKQQLEKEGVRIVSTSTYNYDSAQLVDKHYFYGDSNERGVWYTEEKIQSKLYNFDLANLWLRYSTINGVDVVHEIEYDGLDYSLTADTKGLNFKIGVKQGINKKDFGEINNKNPWINS